MLLTTMLLVLAADPRVSGDANITVKIDGKNEYAAGLHATVPVIAGQLAVSVDLTSRTVADVPTTVGGLSLSAPNWMVGVTMKTQPDGVPQPCVNARATLVTGPSLLTAQLRVSPGDAAEKVVGSVRWASTKVPVAVSLSASTIGSVSVGVSVSSL
jgi:hypothetical protein